MAIQADSIYLSLDDVIADVLGAWAARIPGVNLSRGTIVYTWTQVFGNSVEGLYLGMQLLHDDMFIQTMSALALQREGEELGRQMKAGTLSTGSVRFDGAGGEFIAQGSQVGAPRPQLGDTLVFETTEDATVPNPGIPGAPTIADAAVSGLLTGTFEYAITFTTTEGETEIGTSSGTLVLAASKTNLTAVAVGGPGTTGRRIYRSKNGGAFQFVHALADNVTTIYTDNIVDGALGGNPPTESTAERVTVAAQSTAPGEQYNVGVGTITSLVDVDADVNDVTNAVAFTAGSDSEATEDFRQALLAWSANPQSGSGDDLVAWATSISGVETASVTKNKNPGGGTELGSVVVRISGPGGSVPDGDVVDATQAYIDSKDLANITIYVVTFTPTTVSADLTITLAPGYDLDDVEGSIEQAAADYVNSIPPGGTVYVAGIYHAVFMLPGILTLVVNTPSADVVIAADHKAVCDPTTDVTVGI